jgi:hypothetical protein
MPRVQGAKCGRAPPSGYWARLAGSMAGGLGGELQAGCCVTRQGRASGLQRFEWLWAWLARRARSLGARR